MGPPKGGSKSRFHAGFSHKSRQEIAWNSCSRQVYPITLNAMLIFHAITPIFTSNSRFHALKYVQSRHHAFPLGGPFPCNYINNDDVCCLISDNAFHDCITISGRAHGDFVVNFFRAMSASPCAKNVLRMFEAHFWKKIRTLSLDEKIHHSYKKSVYPRGSLLSP